MKLNKAIKLAKEVAYAAKKGKFHDHANAIELLTEAGECILKLRPVLTDPRSTYLPGETKD